LSRTGSSSGDGSPRWLRRNGKKGIRRCKEDFLYVLKWQWRCYKSVARIRLVKTENIIVCVTVKWKCVDQQKRCVACSSELNVLSVIKSNHPIQNPHYTYTMHEPHTRDNIITEQNKEITLWISGRKQVQFLKRCVSSVCWTMEKVHVLNNSTSKGPR
jgi:hypothetical protein